MTTTDDSVYGARRDRDKIRVSLSGAEWLKIALMLIAAIGGGIFGVGLATGRKMETIDRMETKVEETQRAVSALKQDNKENTAELKQNLQRLDDKVERLQERIARRPAG